MTKPNRPRILEPVPSRDTAKRYREVFAARAVESEITIPFDWPRELQHVGESLAVAYSSDKWQDKGDLKAYKHVAESRNQAFVLPGFLRPYEDQSRDLRTIGPTVGFGNVPMPKHFAILGLFEELNLRLHTKGSDSAPAFGAGPDVGCVAIIVKHAMLGGSKIRWSTIDKTRKDQPFLFVYVEPNGKREPGGIFVVIVGDELDIEKDGIVG